MSARRFVWVLLLAVACKKERREPPPPPHVDYEGALLRDFYGGCAPDADVPAVGTPVFDVDAWLAARHVTEVYADGCWNDVIAGTERVRSLSARRLRPLSEVCRCDRELRAPGRDLLVCVKQHDLFLYVAAGKTLDAAVAHRAMMDDVPDPTIEWVPEERRQEQGARHWPPPNIQLVPVVERSSVFMAERPCGRCARALAVTKERLREYRELRVDSLAEAWTKLQQHYEDICDKVGEWRWDGDTLVRHTNPFPKPQPARPRHDSTPPTYFER